MRKEYQCFAPNAVSKDNTSSSDRQPQLAATINAAPMTSPADKSSQFPGEHF
jgi:hypothetical protein